MKYVIVAVGGAVVGGVFVALTIGHLAADAIDERFPLGRRKRLHITKVLVLLFLLAASLGPNVSQIMRIRETRDVEIIGREIGAIVGKNLILTTSE